MSKKVETPIRIARYSRSIFGWRDLPGNYSVEDQRINYGASYEDCNCCNYVLHQCPGCGEDLHHDRTEYCDYGPERLHPNCWED